MTTQLFLTALAVTTIIMGAFAASADWRSHRVPNPLVRWAMAPVVLAVVVGDEPIQRLFSVAVGTGVMALPLLLIHLVAPSAMGFGDVKLAAVLGAAVGVLAPVLAIPALATAAALTLVVAACTRRVAVPFAPGLVAGVAAALALGTFEGWKAAV
ncbi:MAG TPA: A24 family peptidase, partial [Ilumatobacteraceae bacterium]|nr:A24 family peptidase [Ilumatobacteraceae bacterium]